MARTCAVAAALCVAILVAAAPAAARPRALNVALPSPGDVTLMHVEFKRSVASRRRLPRFRPLSASALHMVRHARIAVIGSVMRTSRTRVIGSVVLLRAKGTRAAVSARRSLRVVVGGPVASIVTQRNVLRRRAPRSPGVRAAGGEAPSFCATNKEIVDGAYRSYDHGEFLGVDFGGHRLKSEVRYEPDVPALAYGLYCDMYRPDLTPLLTAIGSRFPVSCTFTGTYIGAATDSEGNVLTEPSYNFGFQCSKTIDELALVVYEGYVKYCEDAADRPCSITSTTTERDTALFQFRLPANLDWSVTIGGDPPLMRGGKIDIVIDLVDGAQVRDEQVM